MVMANSQTCNSTNIDVLSCCRPMNLTLFTPTNVAFADINGDCMPDLVIHSTAGCSAENNNGSLVVMTSRAKGASTVMFNTLSWSRCIDLNYMPGSITVSDVNGDGNLDILVPEAHGGRAVYMYINSQLLRHKDELCTADNNFKFESPTVMTMPDGLTLTGSNDNPTSIHFADYDIDGIPDLLIGVSDDNTTRVLLFRLINNAWLSVDIDDVVNLRNVSVAAFVDLVFLFLFLLMFRTMMDLWILLHKENKAIFMR